MLFDTRLPQPGHVAIAQANTHGAPFPSDERKEPLPRAKLLSFFGQTRWESRTSPPQERDLGDDGFIAPNGAAYSSGTCRTNDDHKHAAPLRAGNLSRH